MSELERFRREAWGLQRVLFRIRLLEEPDLSLVFTAREREMERALSLLGDAPGNLLVNGLFGVGKTAFLRMLLRNLRECYGEQVLCVSECLDGEDADLPTTILRGLAHALRDEDAEAKAIDDLLAGVELTTQLTDKATGGGELNIGIFKGGGGGETSATESRVRKLVPSAPYQARQLIERAVARSPQRRLVVAVDDLDKRDPQTVRVNLSAARTTLHNHPCSFIFTGHPLSVLRDAYSSLGGIFDDQLELKALAHDQRRQLMINYLEAGRQRGALDPQHGLFPFTEDAAQAIMQHSFGLPRVLNVICYHVLSEAAELRLPQIDRQALSHCWQRAGSRLRRAARGDVRSLLEVVSEQSEGLDPLHASDEAFDRLSVSLGVDTTESLLNRLHAFLQHPESLIVGIEREGRSLFLPQPLLQPLPPSEGETQTEKKDTPE